MKKIILIVALFSTTTLFAQTQNDNSLVIDITAIQKTIDTYTGSEGKRLIAVCDLRYFIYVGYLLLDG